MESLVATLRSHNYLKNNNQFYCGRKEWFPQEDKDYAIKMKNRCSTSKNSRCLTGIWLEKSFPGATKPGSFFSPYDRLPREAVTFTKEGCFVGRQPQTVDEPHICLPENRKVCSRISTSWSMGKVTCSVVCTCIIRRMALHGIHVQKVASWARSVDGVLMSHTYLCSPSNRVRNFNWSELDKAVSKPIFKTLPRWSYTTNVIHSKVKASRGLSCDCSAKPLPKISEESKQLRWS